MRLHVIKYRLCLYLTVHAFASSFKVTNQTSETQRRETNRESLLGSTASTLVQLSDRLSVPSVSLPFPLNCWHIANEAIWHGGSVTIDLPHGTLDPCPDVSGRSRTILGDRIKDATIQTDSHVACEIEGGRHSIDKSDLLVWGKGWAARGRVVDCWCYFSNSVYGVATFKCLVLMHTMHQ